MLDSFWNFAYVSNYLYLKSFEMRVSKIFKCHEFHQGHSEKLL